MELIDFAFQYLNLCALFIGWVAMIVFVLFAAIELALAIKEHLCQHFRFDVCRAYLLITAYTVGFAVVNKRLKEYDHAQDDALGLLRKHFGDYVVIVAPPKCLRKPKSAA
mgnify:CR=1 FL=1